MATTKALTLYDTSVGKKAALALSGVILFGFVIVHMLGNLQVLEGPEVYNAYAEGLKSKPVLLWGVRALLLVALLVHTWIVLELYGKSIAARPVGYKVKKNIATSYAAMMMKFTGPLLLVYIIFHLAHFTFPGTALGDYDHVPGDVYANFVNAFSIPWVVAVYVLANLMLCMHLYHGAFSMLQSVGLNHPRYNKVAKNLARALAFLVTAGNVFLPLTVLLGLVK
ncbi:MAG TPA: succinate dehydrogenase cytochrome b subunit [Polyangiaceae bacterium]|jgi:succinate dehydrogenase / fumarate reductase cytochrome b subunit|nr:succinate dehydrogenase cytochrome b subunit [Polyangiaceae bacterium]